MRSECTNFPYGLRNRKTEENSCFPHPRVVAGRVEMAKTVKSCQKVSKGDFLTPFAEVMSGAA